MTVRTVLVTGASGGIGRGIALACGAVGWRVWIAARRDAEGAAVADEVTAVGGDGRSVRCDVGDEASVRAAPLGSSPAMAKAFVADPAMEQRVMGRIPLGRLGDVTDDVGAVVRFLLSDDARFVTGQTVMADGGSCPIT